MKRLFYTITLQLLTAIPGFAQMGHIDSMAVVPAQPKAGDTVRVLAFCQFAYSGCEMKSLSIDQNGLRASAVHCIGLLTALCHRTDTIVLHPRPAGNYTFTLELGTGNGASCDSIIPADEDSVSFSVTRVPGSVPGVPQTSGPLQAFYQNGKVYVQNLPGGLERYDMQVVSANGQVLWRGTDCQRDKAVPVELAPGIYIVSINKDQHRLAGKFTVN